MPLHDFMCVGGHITEALVAQGVNLIECQACGRDAGKVFLKAPAGYVQGDIHYESPVDGRPITSKQARIEDLARHNCVPYEPSMKADHMRRLAKADEQLGRDVESHFDAAVAQMPARKREVLEQELRSGADIEFTRA